MSARFLTRPPSTSCSTRISPMPSMSSAVRCAKCRTDSLSRAGQLTLTQRRTTSSCSRTRAVAQTGQAEGMRKGRRSAALLDDADDFGDDVAAALDEHAVADLEFEAGDLVFVVERGAGDGNAADEYRLQPGPGSDRAGAPNLHVDVFDDGFGLFGGGFVSDSPTRGFGGGAQTALQGGGIDLVNQAVDFVGQGIAAVNPPGCGIRTVRRGR